MKIIDKIMKNLVYHLTDKPKQYVHVDKPKSLQDDRQVQYNKWCKAKSVYNGSYLPSNPDVLTESGKKGWYETKGSKDGKIRNFKRKSSGQTVRYDGETDKQIAHYHWNNPKPTIRNLKLQTKYLDRYGNPCTERDDSHHLAPLDKNCPKKALKRYSK